jgi:hypothetical protein
VAIAFLVEEDLLRAVWGDVQEVGRAAVPWLGADVSRPIYVCRAPVEGLEVVWDRFKRYR